MKHLMIDIESLGTGQNAVLLSAGYLFFNPEVPAEVGPGRTLRYPIQPQLDAGRIVTGSTIEWWLQQSPYAIFDAFHATRDEPSSYGYLINAVNDADVIWANGPDFDCVILADFYKGHKWPFWKHRCVRTFKNIFSDFWNPDNINRGTAHNAMDDCKAQIEIIQTIYQGLNKKGVVLR